MMKLFYTTGWAHKTARPFSVQLDWSPPAAVSTGFIAFDSAGTLHIAKEYAWNGASGPVIETKNSLPATLVHDALYQLFREGILPTSLRPFADQTLYQLLVEAGMNPIRARLWHAAVVIFGQKHATPKADIILEAP